MQNFWYVKAGFTGKPVHFLDSSSERSFLGTFFAFHHLSFIFNKEERMPKRNKQDKAGKKGKGGKKGKKAQPES
jgi:hypothetical protein